MNKGFTLIETLVAVFILGVSIAGPITFVSSALQSSYYSRDQVTAFYLAQEAVELIKNIRDTNLLNGNDWTNNLGSCLSGDCELSFNQRDGILEICTSNCEIMNKFTRKIHIEDLSGRDLGDDLEGNGYIVSVNIEWKTGLVNREFSVQQLITDWVPEI